MNMKIGLGYDIHRTCPGRELKLCGIVVPCEFGLEGHSDADVVFHALSDAILGALALPDIGTYFPDSLQETKDMDSKKILLFAKGEASKMGFKIGNIDIVIIAESPKLNVFFDSMRKNLAEILKILPTNVGLKAKTHEQLGDIGHKQAIAAFANVLLTD
ncbi:MAG: 2-C-methyl-D-erythritol 2,4-cyclodiphosphate synthase [Opitutales bacterium]|nr:2-C-methyl-D-erythritol 2,4-cyclodiphosphate synthase [Opitutales bacterium]